MPTIKRKSASSIPTPSPKPPVKAPAPTRKTTSEGHTIQKLSKPVETRNLKAGMKVFYSGEAWTISRVKSPADKTTPHLILVELRGSPTRGSITTVGHRTDLWYTSAENPTKT